MQGRGPEDTGYLALHCCANQNKKLYALGSEVFQSQHHESGSQASRWSGVERKEKRLQEGDAAKEAQEGVTSSGGRVGKRGTRGWGGERGD